MLGKNGTSGPQRTSRAPPPTNRSCSSPTRVRAPADDGVVAELVQRPPGRRAVGEPGASARSAADRTVPVERGHASAFARLLRSPGPDVVVQEQHTRPPRSARHGETQVAGLTDGPLRQLTHRRARASPTRSPSSSLTCGLGSLVVTASRLTATMSSPSSRMRSMTSGSPAGAGCEHQHWAAPVPRDLGAGGQPGPRGLRIAARGDDHEVQSRRRDGEVMPAGERADQRAVRRTVTRDDVDDADAGVDLGGRVVPAESSALVAGRAGASEDHGCRFRDRSASPPVAEGGSGLVGVQHRGGGRAHVGCLGSDRG